MKWFNVMSLPFIYLSDCLYFIHISACNSYSPIRYTLSLPAHVYDRGRLNVSKSKLNNVFFFYTWKEKWIRIWKRWCESVVRMYINICNYTYIIVSSCELNWWWSLMCKLCGGDLYIIMNSTQLLLYAKLAVDLIYWFKRLPNQPYQSTHVLHNVYNCLLTINGFICLCSYVYILSPV